MTTGRATMLSLIATLLIATGAPAAELTGNFTLGTGYLDNPLGIASDRSAGYLAQSLRLGTLFGGAEQNDALVRHRFKLGYEGNASQFGNETDLGSMRHGLGLEFFRLSRVAAGDPRTHSLSLGLQGSLRSYQGGYTIYDHEEMFSYLAFRRHAGSNALWTGFAALRLRHYGELPEESFVEPHGQLKYQRFFTSRTTLGLAIRAGVKTYNDSVASAVWGTPNLPSTSQAAARLEIAQGMSDRVGMRVRVDSRHTLSDFPYYVSDDIYDSPLLDTYAHEGWDAALIAKWLAPAQVWVELGTSRGEHDFGSMLFAGADGGQTRNDDVTEVFGSLDRRFGGNDGPRLRVSVGWRDQVSSADLYSYDGVYGTTTLTWGL